MRHRPEAFRSPGRLSASALCSLPMAPAAEGQRGSGRGEQGDPAGPQTRGEARREGTPIALLRGALTGARDTGGAAAATGGRRCCHSLAQLLQLAPSGTPIGRAGYAWPSVPGSKVPPPNPRGGAGRETRAEGWGGALLKGQASPRPKMSREHLCLFPTVMTHHL